MNSHDKVMAAMDIEVPDSCGGEPRTLRHYLRDLLLTLWDEGECFSGKRPFGNSGWEYDVYLALVDADLIEGTEDQWGDRCPKDEVAAHDLVRDVIMALFK